MKVEKLRELLAPYKKRPRSSFCTNESRCGL